ncbi:30S ribosomal protein S9 [Chlamydia trachomatis]|nr:30S ribosomal protein S9 [Chlamydia trachomatis]
MYAIAKALVVFNPLLKPRLSKAGLMKSDTRIVERKKPGKVKARKSPTWVKR